MKRLLYKYYINAQKERSLAPCLWLTHNLDTDLTSAFALFCLFPAIAASASAKEKLLPESVLISPGRASISLQTRDKQADAAAPTWTATRVTETPNILKCISLRCAAVNRTELRIAENSMCVYEGWGPRGAAWDTDRHAGRGELICSSALSCSNTHNASVPWVASLQ